MNKIQSVDITGTASTKTLVTGLIGIAGLNRNVTKLLFQETTVALNNDATLIVNLEQEELVQISVKQFLNNAATPLKLAPIEIDLGLALADGQQLTVGIISGATASNYEVAVYYTEGAGT